MANASGKSSYMVAQLGARMHYAVPRILHSTGRLGRLCTDACATKGWPRLLQAWPRRFRPGSLQRFLNRNPHDIPPRLIRANNALGVRFAREYAKTKVALDRVRLFLSIGEEFEDWVIKQDWGPSQGVFVYNSAGSRILREARRRGMRGAVEQTIAPYPVERGILAEERRRFPHWESEDEFGTAPEFEEFIARERREWADAEVILCGSDFVRDGVVAQGGDARKTRVVPYGVESRVDVRPARIHDGPLRVLTVGVVGLRKGAMYAVEAARRLAGRAEFRWVGAFKMNPTARQDLGDAIDFVGPVPRSEIYAQFDWADVYLLPSLVEGSATSTYEALTAARPVVCTPNCGSVIRDGVEGFIVPIRDVDAIVEKLDRLAGDAKLRLTMGEAARLRAAEMDYNAYARGLIAALNG